MFEVKFDGLAGFIGHCDELNALYDFLDRCGFAYDEIMRTCEWAEYADTGSMFHSIDFGYVVIVLDDQDD